MASRHTITLNGSAFTANSGQILLDAALIAGVEMPHDCRAGRCGSCLTKIERGITLGGETHQRGMIYACQARVFSDATLALEDLPPVMSIEARVTRLDDITKDVVEVTMAPAETFDILPGQYCKFSFRGFPARAFSPTAALDGKVRSGRIHLNIKRVRNGRVSTNLGGKIRAGHRLRIDGPFGHAFLRPRQTNRLVLVGSGTGFAPVWAVGHAALCENPERRIVIAAGVRSLPSFYMAAALEFAARHRNVKIIAAVEEEQDLFAQVRQGRPSEHLPDLCADDVVYAAGAPAMVNAVAAQANAAQATFYSDPFEPALDSSEDWISRAVAWMRTG